MTTENQSEKSIYIWSMLLAEESQVKTSGTLLGGGIFRPASRLLAQTFPRIKTLARVSPKLSRLVHGPLDSIKALPNYQFVYPG